MIRKRRRSCFLALLSRRQSELFYMQAASSEYQPDIHKLHHGFQSNTHPHTHACKLSGAEHRPPTPSPPPSMCNFWCISCLWGRSSDDGCDISSAVRMIPSDCSLILSQIPAFTGPLAALVPANTNPLRCFQWQPRLHLKTKAYSNGKKKQQVSLNGREVQVWDAPGDYIPGIT